MKLVTTIKQVEKAMEASLNQFKKNLAALRCGTVSVTLLDPVRVESFGSKVPLFHLATISVGDSRTLIVDVWDKTQTKTIDKAIRDSNLGLNPIISGQQLRIPIPAMDEDRRNGFILSAKQMAETARIAVRQNRKTALDGIKHDEKNGDISQGLKNGRSKDVQDLTDKFVNMINELVEQKIIEIRKV